MAEIKDEMLQVRIDPNLKSRLREAAEEQDITMSDLCRKAFDLYLQSMDGGGRGNDSTAVIKTERLRMFEVYSETALKWLNENAET